MKKAAAIALVLCLILSLAACAPAAKPANSEERPENWNVEAEILKWGNGYVSARTAEELTPFVTSDTTESQKEAYIVMREETRAQMPEGCPFTFDYAYDSLKWTFLEKYKGYELFWAELDSSAYDAAFDAWVAAQGDSNEPINGVGVPMTFLKVGPLLALAIENGKYVAASDEVLLNEIRSKYPYCQTCQGEGGIYESGEEPCAVCGGKKDDTKKKECVDCGAIAEIGESDEETCDNCGGAFFIPVTDNGLNCVNCGDSGFEFVFVDCAACNGKGYIKKK